VTSPGPITGAWLRRVFEANVRDDVFGGYLPTPNAPLLVLLGGQPAAGKTNAQEAVIAANAAAQLVPVTGDDLREYHPDYLALARREPLQMPAATAAVSGGLVRLALDHALDHRYSVLLEGTFRDSEMVAATARRFAEAGYRVEVVAVAAPAAVSRLSAEQRSLGRNGRFGRWTPPQAHEDGLAGSPTTVAALEGLPAVSRVQVRTRDRLVYDNTRDAAGAWSREPAGAAVLRAEQGRELAPSDAAKWLRDYADTFRKAQSRPGYLGAATIPAYRLLQRDAARLIPVAASIPGLDARALRRQSSARHDALEALASSRGRRWRAACGG
jgi:predicted kinase